MDHNFIKGKSFASKISISMVYMRHTAVFLLAKAAIVLIFCGYKCRYIIGRAGLRHFDRGPEAINFGAHRNATQN